MLLDFYQESELEKVYFRGEPVKPSSDPEQVPARFEPQGLPIVSEPKASQLVRLLRNIRIGLERPQRPLKKRCRSFEFTCTGRLENRRRRSVDIARI